ncbi:cytidine deaminase [Umbelopsis sp. PMI_123]|nr:cytidine deaminase [Umbelopsis sp. PMI_123]
MSPIRALTAEEQEKLIDLSLEARDNSYSPYSKFRVGAALLTEDGIWIKGANIENASYGAAICAERTAYVKALSEGHSKFIALGVSTDQDLPVSPCGICRQFISEFGPGDLPVYMITTNRDFKLVTLSELLPYSFSRDEAEKYLL